MYIPDSSINSFQSFFSWAWDGTKQVSLALEPYQPSIAAALIVGKLGYRLYKQQAWKAEVKELSRRIGPLRTFVQKESEELRLLEGYGYPNQQAELAVRQGRLADVQERIEVLKEKLRETNSQLGATAMTFWQIPSLFFSHPGANVWNSTFQIVNRGVNMREQAQASRHQPPSRLKQFATFSGGIISLAGTTASLLRQLGIVHKDNRTSHALIGLAMAVHAIEGISMAKNALKSVSITVKRASIATIFSLGAIWMAKNAIDLLRQNRA